MNPIRHSITIATAGHVDHGKSTLVNRLTDVDTDTLADEKARGLSINLGFAYYTVPHDGTGNPTVEDSPSSGAEELSVGFVDVPGHTDFINNALAGIGIADYSLLVVAADDGVMPQTREHLAIISLLGISGGAIVITKKDKVSAERLTEVEGQIHKLVDGTSLADTPVFPLSSLTGQGIDKLISHLDLLATQAASREVQIRRNPRFAIDRSFTVKGIGTVVTGTVLAGEIGENMSLIHSATGQPVRIRGLRHDQKPVTRAVAGERTAVNLNLPHHQISRGDWLVEETLNHPVNRIDTQLCLLEPVDFKSGVNYHFYHGTDHKLVQVRKLGDGAQSYYQLTSSQPFFASHGDRFILRDPACHETIGGGSVVDVFVPRRGRASDERLNYLSAMDQDDVSALCSLVETRPEGVSLSQFAAGRNCNRQYIDELIGQLTGHGIDFLSLSVGESHDLIVLHSCFFTETEQKILECLANYHSEHSNQAGVTEPKLNALVGFEQSHHLFRAIVEQLVTNNKLTRTGTLLHLPGHKARLTAEEQNFLDRIRPILLNSNFLPPRTRELAEMTGMNLGSLERILAEARKSGHLVQVASNRHYLPETIMKLAKFTESLVRSQEEGFTVIEFRDKLGIGRNLCIEILEYFDRIGFTYRDGNNRYLRTSRENLFGGTADSGNSHSA